MFKKDLVINQLPVQNVPAMNIETTKATRGRPKGATSFTRVSLRDLTENFGPNASIVVGKKWLEEMGLVVDDQPTKVMTISSTTTEEPEEKIQFTIS